MPSDIVLRVHPKLENSKKTCVNGHAMEGANVVYRLGIRSCRQCMRDRKKMARERFIKATGG